MDTSLQVMVLESHPGVANAAEAELIAAGHQVRRCHDHHGSGFPCRGITSPRDCPLDHNVDVALLVRRGVAPRPTTLEEGVTCAIRAEVPLIEDGTDLFDPFATLITDRVAPHGDCVAACEQAAALAGRPLEQAIARSFAPILAQHGLPHDAARASVSWQGDSMQVHVESAEELPNTLRGLLCVTASDVAHPLSRRRARVEVSYEVTSGSPASD